MRIWKTAKNVPKPIDDKGFPPRAESAGPGLLPDPPSADNDVPENIDVASTTGEESTRSQELPGSTCDVSIETKPKTKFGLGTAIAPVLILVALGGFAYF